MSVKIRLTRIGRHSEAIYRIVVADSRFARDGRYVEQIGFYNPAKPEEEADINEELALKWLAKGALPSDSIRTLFTKKGIMEKHAATKSKPAPKKAKPAKTAKPAAKPAAKSTSTAKSTATKKTTSTAAKKSTTAKKESK